MRFDLKNLRRLQAMSAAEVLYRLRHEVSDRLEKRAVSRTESEGLEAFLHRHGLLGSDLEDGQALNRLLEAFRERAVFPWQMLPARRIKNFHSRRFAEQKQATLRIAEMAVANEFPVFDRTIKFTEQIDWHLDVLGHRSIPVVFWKDVKYRNPEYVREVKYTWELNRHQHFVTLGKAFFLTGNKRFARTLFSQWLDWIDKNPYPFGINWTSALELGFRLISWTWALQFAKRSRELTPEIFARILQSVEQHARFIERHLSGYSSANNHLIGEAVGLIYAGTYFPELNQAVRWRKLGFEILYREIPAQVYPDGVSKEQTAHYQRYIFDFGILARVAAHFLSYLFPRQVDDVLRKMAHFMSSLMDSRGNVPAIGDEDGGEALRLTEKNDNRYHHVMSTASVVFQDRAFRTFAPTFAESTFWLTGPHGAEVFRRLKPAKEVPSLQRFPYGGYITLRRRGPDGEQHFVFDHGPLGMGSLAAHGHADMLSFWLSVNGEPVLIDSGTYLYAGAGPWRDYFKGTRAHNSVVIDDRDQANSLGLFQWGKKPRPELLHLDESDNEIVFKARHDGYRKLAVFHQREVSFNGSAHWHILDKVSGVDEHKAEFFFHLAPCRIERVDSKSIRCYFENSSITFVFQSDKEMGIDVVSGKEEPVLGWHSPRFGVIVPHPVIIVTVQDVLPIQVLTRLKVDHA